MHGMPFNSLNEVEECFELVDLFIRLQAIVDRNEILWASMMPKNKDFQKILQFFV